MEKPQEQETPSMIEKRLRSSIRVLTDVVESEEDLLFEGQISSAQRCIDILASLQGEDFVEDQNLESYVNSINERFPGSVTNPRTSGR